MMMWMWLWMVLFWAAVIGVAVWVVSSFSRRSRGRDALDTLEERLAKGEIDLDEFERRKAALRADGTGAGSGRFWVFGIALAIAFLVVMPAIMLAAGGWDMDVWNMHGSGQDAASDPIVSGGEVTSVRIEDFSFEPGNLEVPIGARVTWTNYDSAPHDATARDGSWETQRLSNNESGTLTFEAPGTYAYYCSIHPSMKARLTVR